MMHVLVVVFLNEKYNTGGVSQKKKRRGVGHLAMPMSAFCYRKSVIYG